MTGSVGQVQRVFARVGIDLDARGLAEALWLAQHLPRSTDASPKPELGDALSTGDNDLRAPTGELPPAADLKQPRPPSATRAPGFGRDRWETDQRATNRLPVHLRPRATPRDQATPATPLLAPAAPAIPDTLRLMRSLRPLKRTVASRHRAVLDEEATVRRIAERRIWLPVLQPARERWLDLVLVADLDASGQLWGQPAAELYALFRRLGAFRDVRLRHLRTDAAGVPWVTASGHSRGGTPRSPSELTDPTGRRLILVLTDGVGEAWRTGRLSEVVRRWARSGPVAVLQPLPAHLWERTALRPSPGRLLTPAPGVPNSRLSFVSYRRRPFARSPDTVPVPVLEIDAEWLGPWARLTSGNAHGGIDASVLHAGGGPRPAPTAQREPQKAAERVMAFRTEATPQAYELLTYLSAAPLSLPLMRTVQAAMMPGSSPAHLAEILFSGLVVTVANDGHLGEDRYEFVEGVRDVLLGTLHRHDVERVDQEVSTFIERWLRLRGAGFAAAVRTTSGELTLPEESRPFAHLRAEIFARVTGRSMPADATDQTADRAPDHDPAAGGRADRWEPVPGVGAADAGALTGLPRIAEVLNAAGGVVGTAVLIGRRYVATCAHVANRALGATERSVRWPYEAVQVRLIPRPGDPASSPTYTASVAAWPPYANTFDELDVVILRVDGEDFTGVPERVSFAAAQPRETVLVITASQSLTAEVALTTRARLHLRTAPNTPAVLDVSGAPVVRPSTGEILGLANGRLSAGWPSSGLAVLSAGVLDQVIDDYLHLPRPPGDPVPPHAVPRRSRHAAPAPEPGPAGVEEFPESGQLTQFAPLNETEHRLFAVIHTSSEDLRDVLVSAQVWADGVPPGTKLETATDLLSRLPTRGKPRAALVTAPQRATSPAAGPWPLFMVARRWGGEVTMLLNPGTPIRLELTPTEIRELARGDQSLTATTVELSDIVHDAPVEVVRAEGTAARDDVFSAPQGRRFPRRFTRRGYDADEVDTFVDHVKRTLTAYQQGDRPDRPLTSREIHEVIFRVRFNGYDEWKVDLWLDEVERRVRRFET
ncbi:SAV_2336 N-terminal domain-related protein [Micromonospora echinospora]|uniref:SAV_2336 N-terminal domain-related protein n=1 Tax=Micromonospora echinospora TaxID=1877 RepID=UPI003A852760